MNPTRLQVIKRDDSIQEYSFSKIENAVMKAFKSVGKFSNEEVDKFMQHLKGVFEKTIKDQITVEEIQDIIQKELIKKNKYDVVEAFIIYRKERAEARQEKSKLIKDINKALSASDVQNQNANVDEASFGGRIGEAGRVVCKDRALKHMSKMSRKNHEDGYVYIHDLDSYEAGMHNCLSIPFDDLLKNGFTTRQTDVRPASSVSTAMQLVAVIFQLQSLQQFGGVSATHLDWTMVPYVRKSFFKHYNEIRETANMLTFGLFNIKQKEMSKEDIRNTSINDKFYIGNSWFNVFKRIISKVALKRTEREIYQSVEGLYHNLNTLQSRSGNQLPFTSINYGTCTLSEGRMVTNALLDVSMEGLGKYHKTSIFPCGIFQYMKGVNNKPGTPNYDLYRKALKSTAKRIYPNYANVDWSGNAGYDRNDPKTYFSTMGCRTANGFDINGLGQQKDGRGNICPVTVILPTIAMEAKLKCEKTGKELIPEFMKMLDKKICEAKDMLLERFEHICSQSPASAKFMWENNTMAGYVPEEGIRSALKHGTLALGQLGLAECLQILIGCDHTTDAGMNLAKEIESLFKTRCAEFKESYKLNFGVYYTPAENLCYTALKKFRSKYGIIKNVSDKEWFTNSIHVPVQKNVDPFEKIDIESQLTGYSSAGCITYVELPSTAINNIDAVESMVNYAMDKDIPYFALNFPLDSCNNCHAQGDFNGKCPECGSTDIDELRRVTGYLSTTKKHFNKGKQEECDNRVKHIKG